MTKSTIESANPRHGHEWKIWQEIKLPEGKILFPGVIDDTTYFIEHPEIGRRAHRSVYTLNNTEQLLDDLRNQILQRDAVPLENGDEHFVYATDLPYRDTEFQKICTGY